MNKLIILLAILFANLIAFSAGNLSIDAMKLLHDYKSASTQTDKLKFKEKNSLMGDATNLKVSAYIQYDADLDKDKLRSLGCDIQLDLDGIMTCLLPLDNMEEISNLPGVIKITAGLKLEQHLDAAIRHGGVLDVQNGILNDTKYDGTGVIVGVIDRGFDFEHPMFSDAAGNCRITRAWITDAIGTPPEGYSYGALYTSPNTIKNSVKYSSTDENHASHVLGIAAGRNEEGEGASTGFGGVAPKAEIVAVELKSGTSIANAIDYIFSYADSVNKPCVINISLGYSILSTVANGMSAPALAIKQIMQKQRKGRIVCVSAGNEGGDNNHYSVKASLNKEYVTKVDFYQPPYQIISPEVLTIANKGEAFELLIEVKDNKGQTHRFGWFSSNESRYEDVSENSDFTLVVYTGPDIGDGGLPEIDFYLVAAGTTITELTYKVRSANANIHSWASVPLEAGTGGHTIDSKYSISVPADLDEVISVGAYTSKNKFTNYSGQNMDFSTMKVDDISYFSSLGPTIDGRIKPDITAPGAYLISAANRYYSKWSERLSYITETRTQTPYYWATQGTSMSSPFAAGCIALALQESPGLSTDNIKQLFKSTATNDNYTGNAKQNKSNTWGYGKINIKNMLADLTGANMAGVERPTQISPENRTANLNTIKLVWTKGNNTDYAFYQIQISKALNFEDNIVYELQGDTNISISLESQTRYYWKVRAFNKAGDTTDFTNVWYFITGNTAAIPRLVSPVNNVIVDMNNAILKWRTVTGAANYTCQIGSDNSFAPGTYREYTTTDTTYKVNAKMETKYFWRVRSTNSSNINSDFSAIRNFSTSNVGINDNSMISQFIISPNPASNFANLNFTILNDENVAIKIYDILGKEIYNISKFYSIGEYSIPLDFSNYLNGTYICCMFIKDKKIASTNFTISK